MLCPKRKRVYPSKDKHGSDIGTEEDFLECYKEKCALWVENPNKFPNGDKMKPNYSGGNCAIKVNAEKT